ncbi:SCO4225 family membrane protein [Streptomyces sp. NPDC058872]|uniref:SCO4225 family membrane protein n=1 Tax=Streptomyces sp. NPDC058872 TaxID=3346661 RepID=UPI003693CB48
MERRWSKAEMWVPGGYLVLVLALEFWTYALGRTGDAGFAGIWPLLATAPVSLLLLGLFGPAMQAAAGPAPEVVPHYGDQPPTPLSAELSPENTPLPADWTPDTTTALGPEPWSVLGFHAAVLIGALVNAAAIWAFVRFLVRRRPASAGRAGA